MMPVEMAMPAADTAPAVPTTAAGAAARPWRRAGLWLIFLGPFFFISYGFANWWTSRLPHVESLFFAWERHIPFWEWTILPYMSIDAFYAVSLFLCVTRAELDAHAKRLLAATVISVAGFLLFPLRFSFIRPPTDGFNGWLFDVLTGFDKPFNQAPSLHISLLILLWVVYARRLRGIALYLLHGWFLLIGISVFTTYQHHVIDGISGLAVGVLCLYLFPDHPGQWRRETGDHADSPRRQQRRRLQHAYLSASLALFLAAVLIRSWAWFLLWPCASLLLAGLAYAGFGTRIFRKSAGRIAWPARLLLLPYLAGAWISSRWYTRRIPAYAQIVDGVWIGRAPGTADLKRLRPAAVLDLTAEFHADPDARAVQYRNVPMLDLLAPTPAQLQEAVQALELMHTHGPVLVHCALGYSRSALVIAAWLLRHGMASTPEQAVALVRAARPQIVLTPQHASLLAQLHDA